MKTLICDDDDGVRFAIRRLVQSLGCSTVEASDGARALEVLASNSISLLILDLSMPVLDGLEVLQAVRESPEHANLPVIVISGIGNETTAAEVIQLGVSDYLTKPFKFDKARTRLERVIQQLQKRDPAEKKISANLPATSRPILIVDGDSELRYFVANVLAPKYQTVQAATGVEAIQLCETCRPAAVIIGDNIGMFRPELLAKKLRRQPQLSNTRLYFIGAQDGSGQADSSTFDGIMKRTFVPEEFSAQFRQLYERMVVENGNGFAAVRRTLVSAAQQAMGMMAHTDVSMVGTVQGELVDSELVGSVTLHVLDEGTATRIALYCSKETAVRITARTLQVEESAVSLEDSMSAVGEVVNVIAGRVQGAIVADGGASRFTLPEIAEQTDPVTIGPEDVVLRFESSARDLSFSLFVTLEEPTAANAVNAA